MGSLQAILDREHAMPRCTRRLVAADLAGTQWAASLAAGFGCMSHPSG
jgi:O-methyltransferase involved in polyketide biosynthesis